MSTGDICPEGLGSARALLVDLLPGRSQLMGPSQAHSLLPCSLRAQDPNTLCVGGHSLLEPARGLASLFCDPSSAQRWGSMWPDSASGEDTGAQVLPQSAPAKGQCAQGSNKRLYCHPLPPPHPRSWQGAAQDSFLLPSISDLPDQCSPNPCSKEGTQVCQDLMGNFFCQCKAGWAGRLCDKGKAATAAGLGPPSFPLPAPTTLPHVGTQPCGSVLAETRVGGMEVPAGCPRIQAPRWSASTQLLGEEGGDAWAGHPRPLTGVIPE